MRREICGGATFNRQVLGNVSATSTPSSSIAKGASLIGLGDIVIEPLDRDTTSDSAYAGLTLNWDKAQWRWNVTGNADWARDVTAPIATIPCSPATAHLKRAPRPT